MNGSTNHSSHRRTSGRPVRRRRHAWTGAAVAAVAAALVVFGTATPAQAGVRGEGGYHRGGKKDGVSVSVGFRSGHAYRRGHDRGPKFGFAIRVDKGKTRAGFSYRSGGYHRGRFGHWGHDRNWGHGRGGYGRYGYRHGYRHGYRDGYCSTGYGHRPRVTYREERVLVTPGHYVTKYHPPVTKRVCRHGRWIDILVKPGYHEKIWVEPVYETRKVKVVR